MKIAIVGYGKMGHAVEKMARARGHEIVSIIDVDNVAEVDSEAFKSADVAIEFTAPDAALGNLRRIFAAGVPVVSGTTGWGNPITDHEIEQACAHGATLLSSPNFSIGVNVVNAASKVLARLLEPFDYYTVALNEVHHIHKKDHPSGTAILLADGIVECNNRYDAWSEPTSESHTGNAVPITHAREGEVPGIHTIEWDSPQDTITLTHTAKGREGFAVGALISAEWLARAPRGHRYSMDDVLATAMHNDLYNLP